MTKSHLCGMNCICAGSGSSAHAAQRSWQSWHHHPDESGIRSSWAGCGGGRVLSAAARRSLCQHKTQSTISSQFLSQSGPGPRKIMSRDVSCQIPRIRGKAGVINYKCPEIGWHQGDTGTHRGQAPVLTGNWSRRPKVHSCTFNPFIENCLFFINPHGSLSLLYLDKDKNIKWMWLLISNF